MQSVNIGIPAPVMHKYEGRAPLTPAAISRIKAAYPKINFLVQRSPIRVFSAPEYREAGAEVLAVLGDQASIFFGVKQMPHDFFRPGLTYIFFPHVHKGQKENMFMLKRMMEKGCTLIDYEHITDELGNRLVAFGYFAGVAGMTDTLYALGKRLEYEGLKDNPFSQLKQTYDYRTIAEIKAQLKEIGDEIRAKGLPAALSPLIVGFTGARGRVGTGATEIFDALGPKEIKPRDLLESNVFSSLSSFEIYKIVFEREDRVKPKDCAQVFSREGFALNPCDYESALPPYLPLLTAFVNGAYWEPPQPRLISNQDLHFLFNRKGVTPRLRIIGDISCDVDGGVQATVRGTDVEKPFFVFNPHTGKAPAGWQGFGVVINALETSACELSLEASNHFSRVLEPLVPEIAFGDYAADYETGIKSFSDQIRRGIVIWKGKRTPYFETIRVLSEGLEQYGDTFIDVNY